MLCAELERMESEFDDLIAALEDPNLSEGDKRALQQAYAALSRAIQDHQRAGHNGGPCCEE